MLSRVDVIDPSNAALKYLKARIADSDYRGNIGSQHNRWDINELINIVNGIKKHADSSGLLKIRTTDLSKRPGNLPDEKEYADFCNEICTLEGKGTQDSIRKNLFPDFHRGGWIRRFDKNKSEVDPYGRTGVVYVSLSELGLKLANAENLIDKYFIFSKGVDKLLGGAISNLLHILSADDPDFGYVDLLEYTFFVSAVGAKSPNVGITLSKCKELILEFRKLSRYQKLGVDQHLARELVQNARLISKVDQRDYHNWINASQQAFSILRETVYFEERQHDKNSHLNRLVWMQKTDVKLNEDEKKLEAEKRLKRSLQQKHEYFKQHGISKTKGFELHHVVALAWAESEHHFKKLDSWKNMVYIDGYSHAKITQNQNRNVRMSISDADIYLTDFSENTVEMFFPKNIIWDPSKSHDLASYNSDLLEFVNIES